LARQGMIRFNPGLRRVREQLTDGVRFASDFGPESTYSGMDNLSRLLGVCEEDGERVSTEPLGIQVETDYSIVACGGSAFRGP